MPLVSSIVALARSGFVLLRVLVFQLNTFLGNVLISFKHPSACAVKVFIIAIEHLLHGIFLQLVVFLLTFHQR